jgi:predicted metalloprotease with PDZ domain
MGYGEQRFDRYVQSVTAVSNTGEPLLVQRVEGPRWRIGRDNARLSHLEYEVDLARMEREIYSAADSSRIRPGYLGLLGYSIFAYVKGFEDRLIRLHINGPAGWPIFSTLAPRAPPTNLAFTVEAANFYVLADSQIAMGPKLQVQRLPGTVPLFVALYAEGEVDLELEGKLSLDAMEQLIAYFGNAPFKHYTVQVELLRPVSSNHSYGFSIRIAGDFRRRHGSRYPRDHGQVAATAGAVANH